MKNKGFGFANKIEMEKREWRVMLLLIMVASREGKKKKKKRRRGSYFLV